MKFALSRPARCDIMILDGGQPVIADLLSTLFDGAPFTVFDSERSIRYITPAIIARAIWYLVCSRSITVAYGAALVRAVHPKIVVTFIDNSRLFQRVARLLKARGPRFLAIQNGVRMLARDNPPGSPQIFHSEFACFGGHDVAQYRAHGACVEKFYPIGSLRDSLYRAGRGTAAVAKRYDLCLISQIKPQHYKAHPRTMRSLALLAAHTRRYCEMHGTSVCVAARRHPEHNAQLFEWEQTWFREHLGDWVDVIPNDPGEYTSYSLVDQSRVSLALHTTLLYEGFGRGNRVLSCNFTGDPLYSFPAGSPWALDSADYETFEKRLGSLLTMPDETYIRSAGHWPAHLIAYDPQQPAHEFLRRIISEAVRGAPVSAATDHA